MTLWLWGGFLVSTLLLLALDLGVLTWRRARRTLVLLAGSSLFVVGALMLVLPGPGLLVVAAGLGLLATEFYWARRWLAQVSERLSQIRRSVTGVRGRIQKGGMTG